MDVWIYMWIYYVDNWIVDIYGNMGICGDIYGDM